MDAAAIDLTAETRVSIREAAQREGVDYETVRRWIDQGVRGGVRLEWFPRGGRMFTTIEALKRFYGRIAQRRNGTTSATEEKARELRRMADAARQRIELVHSPYRQR